MTRPQNAIEILNGLRYFGVGAALRRTIFKFPESYWIITKVKLSKDQNHGRAYGRLVWRGKAREKEERIHSARKSEWVLHSLPNYRNFIAKPTQIEELIPKNSERTC